MQRQPVVSRALASVGYDADARELELEFRTGRIYRYLDVPPSVHDWLLRASNKGVYIARHISGRYAERSLPDASSGHVSSSGQVPSEPMSLEQALLASLAAVTSSPRSG
jgi:hypothetical protein